VHCNVQRRPNQHAPEIHVTVSLFSAPSQNFDNLQGGEVVDVDVGRGAFLSNGKVGAGLVHTDGADPPSVTPKDVPRLPRIQI
jgi:hypothetical protein